MSTYRRVRDLRPGEMVKMLRLDGTIGWCRGRSDFDPLAETVLCTVQMVLPVDDETWRLTMLADGRPYHTDVGPYLTTLVVPTHHPVCGECGELWPCRDDRQRAAALRFTHALDSMCAHCGEPIGGAWMDSFNDGLTTRRYHTAKKYRANGVRCVDALAAARAETPGHTTAPEDEQ